MAVFIKLSKDGFKSPIFINPETIASMTEILIDGVYAHTMVVLTNGNGHRIVETLEQIMSLVKPKSKGGSTAI